MPERPFPATEPLARAVAALSAAAPGLDGTALADVLWLASRMAADADGESSAPLPPRPAEEAEYAQEAVSQGELRGAWQQPVPAAVVPAVPVGPAREADVDEAPAVARQETRSREPGAAPDEGPHPALSMTRALRPWKRLWPRGRRMLLDIEATVEAYARSGELIPQFRPAPERWFDLVLVVDRSPAMRVWRETIGDFTAALAWLGAFRTLHIRTLDFGGAGPELRTGLGRLTGPDQLRSSDGRRLMVVVSDCAAPGWREAAVWQRLRTWSLSTPVALLNPLPPKLWRRTGLDLPTVRVQAGTPGPAGFRLDFDPPLLRPYDNRAGGDVGWQPVPVLSMSPHTLDRWSRTLMRAAPEGCGAVLVPRAGRMDGPERPRSAAVSAEGFLRTASPPAARLAVLCSAFDRLGTRLLHLIRTELVPEASTSDLAELLTSGLFTQHTERDGTVEMRLPQTVRQRLSKELPVHEVWRLHRALSSHGVLSAGGGGRARSQASGDETDAELRPFGQASQQTLELLGLARDAATEEVPHGEEGAREGARPTAATAATADTADAADAAETVDTDRPSDRDAHERERAGQSAPDTPPQPPVEEGYALSPMGAWGSVPDNRPYFFLSYAHTPPWGAGGGDPDHWVQRLFTDLCDHIMALTDLPPGAAAGFMDREMRSGDGWPEKLSENLAHCRVFVPLLSPRYFTSESCGREWYAFNERIVHARAAGHAPDPAIVPALWTHVDYAQLPESVRHIHIDHVAPGDRYAVNGIYGLIKLNRLHDEYDEVVLSLAQRIVRVAHESPLPTGRPRPYESTPSAFKPRGEGPRRIHLTVAAPTRDSIPEHRDALAYGEDSRDWNPYGSESVRPLPALAEDLIRSLDYRITVSSFDDLDTGEDRAGHGDDKPGPIWPGILLIDPWVLTDEERRRRLAEFDANSRPWVSAIIPWDRADLQSHGEEGRKLLTALESTLPTILDRGRRADCRVAVAGVPTLKAFTDVLPAVVAHATRQYLKHATFVPPAGPHLPRPRLVGPTPPPYPEGTS